MEWCAVWKGSVKDCLDHLCSKHDGAQLMAMKTLGKFVPPWTVSREFWQAALRPDMSGVETDVRLFHESGCRFVHRYRIYKDPMPHVSLQGKVVANLIMFVHRATTHLHLAIPSFGTTTEPVPLECYMVVPLSRQPVWPVKVSFAEDVEIKRIHRVFWTRQDFCVGEPLENSIHLEKGHGFFFSPVHHCTQK